jgi:hypothetical protein
MNGRILWLGAALTAITSSVGAQAPTDCSTALRALVPAGQSTDPARYVAKQPDSAAHKAGSLVYLNRTRQKGDASKQLECRTQSGTDVTCWSCVRNESGRTVCEKKQCARAGTQKRPPRASP